PGATSTTRRPSRRATSKGGWCATPRSPAPATSPSASSTPACGCAARPGTRRGASWETPEGGHPDRVPALRSLRLPLLVPDLLDVGVAHAVAGHQHLDVGSEPVHLGPLALGFGAVAVLQQRQQPPG